VSNVDYVPVAQQFVSPYPKALIPDYTGAETASGSGAGGGGGTGAAASLDQLPTTQDLSWVAGDTATFTFFFQNVCWTPVVPVPPPTLYTWENVTWRAQVRTPGAYYYGYWWPPIYPLGRLLVDFTVTAAYKENDPVLATGTLVTLKGGTMWPGSFVWDLQSEHHTDSANPDFYEASTHVRGKATIIGQVSNWQTSPPGYWGVYPYP